MVCLYFLYVLILTKGQLYPEFDQGNLHHSPESDLGKALAIPMGLRHWNPGRGCAPVKNTHSCRTLRGALVLNILI